MRWRLVWLAVALAFSLTEMTTASAAPAAAPFLWRVQGSSTTHYLLGSMHLLPSSADSLPDALEQAYDDADGLVFETDIGALQSRDVQLQLLAAAHADHGLERVIGIALYRRVQARAHQLQMPMSLCGHYRPWFCAISLDIYAFRKAGFSDEYGVDEHFYSEAVTDGKAVHWLESPTQHLALFTAMDTAQSLVFLRAALDQRNDKLDDPQMLYRAWRDDDTTRIAALDRQLRAQYPQIYQRLIAARNRAWMPQLRRLLDGDKPQMIVVGAAHLVGPDGLVQQLRAQGYQVTSGLAPSSDQLSASAASVLHVFKLQR